MELKDLNAPFVYTNWKAAIEKEPSLGSEEFPLFSDARLIGEFKENCGPYQFIHLVGRLAQCGVARPVFILRISCHIDVTVSLPDMDETRDDLYHGGDPAEEIAALASLALGVRLKPGDLSREFTLGDDPLGVPRAFGLKPDPVIPMGSPGLVLPNTCGDHMHRDLGEALKPFATLPQVSPSDATALVQAARLYQDALWIAESEPSLCWLMLVSAVETAANHWRKEKAAPLETLKDSNPELFELLKEAAVENLPQRVADLIADKLQSTKKFIDFCLEFRPPPPPKRSEQEFFRHRWTKRKLKEAMSTIYSHRSKSLHTGRPFPSPMCRAPTMTHVGGSPEEILPGSAAAAGYATWTKKDIPMLLHTFEYFVRQSLLRWWKSMTSESCHDQYL